MLYIGGLLENSKCKKYMNVSGLLPLSTGMPKDCMRYLQDKATCRHRAFRSLMSICAAILRPSRVKQSEALAVSRGITSANGCHMRLTSYMFFTSSIWFESIKYVTKQTVESDWA